MTYTELLASIIRSNLPENFSGLADVIAKKANIALNLDGPVLTPSEIRDWLNDIGREVTYLKLAIINGERHEELETRCIVIRDMIQKDKDALVEKGAEIIKKEILSDEHDAAVKVSELVKQISEEVRNTSASVDRALVSINEAMELFK
jgi:hypothetical protein